MTSMSRVEILGLNPGDRIYRWVHTGTFKGYDAADIQTLTVIRVNRTTVTVSNDHGGTFRLPHQDVSGRVDWEEQA